MEFLELQVVPGVLLGKLTEWMVQEHVDDAFIESTQSSSLQRCFLEISCIIHESKDEGVHKPP